MTECMIASILLAVAEEPNMYLFLHPKVMHTETALESSCAEGIGSC